MGIFLRDDQGRLTAGVYGFAWAGCCEVEYLWVSESQRRKGLGSTLIRRIEEEARRLGCSKIVLDTFSFQAPRFYEKHGFDIVSTIEDFPEGHRHHMAVKHL